MRFGKIARFVRYALPATSPAKIAERLFLRGSAARNAGQYLAAAALYEEVLRITPGIGRIHVQAGHMFKEAGDLDQAEAHYRYAERLMPDDADLAMQFGHFFKVAGRLDEAEDAYRRALALQPDWAEAADELAAVESGSRGAAAGAAGGDVPGIDRLVPELLPRAPGTLRRVRREGLQVRRLGVRRERTRWGTMKVLRGVEAVRGVCVSAIAIRTVEVLVDGRCVHAEPPRAVADGGDPVAYVFNIWHDFAAVEPGRHVVEIRCTDARRRTWLHRQQVVVAVAEDEAAHPGSDALVTIDRADPRPAEAQIMARPTMVRSARRTRLAVPRSVLVQRVDQLGDLVISIPAILRLRALLPEARIVGLLTSANAPLAETLGLFDDIVVADFPDDPQERRRTMTLTAQQALRARLAAYRFDVAIDLSESGTSRPLLQLSGALFLYGFHSLGAPWLSAEVRGHARDPVNGLESASASTKLVAMIEWLGALMRDPATILPPADGSRAVLAEIGIAADARYVVLHAGARLAFSRWPHHAALARLILARTDLMVVMLTDEAQADPALSANPRFRAIGGAIPFHQFDALLAFCTVFVGNDTGPKHLASLRGADVISLHTARHNWNEWGQDHGLVLSRRVPCAGCGIHYEPEECGRDFACLTAITAEEVFAQVMGFVER